MKTIISGGCVCGKVQFTVEDDFEHFYFCHCEQCRKMTGSAFATNLFTRPDNIQWTEGQEFIKRYEHPTRTFSQVFCTHCGSSLPYVSKSGKALIVPAGSLNTEPSKTPDAQIFCSEETQWHIAGLTAARFPKFPE
ncbi:GFA family protein [Celerinatantimonas sp. YJH-8]|uniref:GFA family protein n=1 Tax=Celerinatantimonas sp. YJH-8 TaxID=3228714 RepID=UPI0038C85FEB